MYFKQVYFISVVFFLSGSSFLMLYKSMILPYLNYCNLVRASSYKTSLQMIVILQKCVIRIVKKSDYCAHLDSIFKKLNSYEHYNLVFSCFNLKILFSLENLKLLFLEK